MISSMIWMVGCSPVNFGPTTKHEIIFQHKYADDGTPLVIGRVAENKKVKVAIPDPDSNGVIIKKVDIGGTNISWPEVKTSK